MTANRLADNDGTCNADGCTESTSWDLPAVIIPGAWFCSPGCAQSAIESGDQSPESITLHDPQFNVSPDRRPAGVDESAVDITRVLSGKDDVETALGEIREMLPGEFRLSPDE